MDKHEETRLHLGRLTRFLDDPLLRINASSLTRISDLGDGGFAHVELCTLNQGGVKRKVAVKRFHESILADNTCLKLLCQEIEVMAKNKHPYMVQLIGVGAGDLESEETIRKSLFIVQDCCHGGNLKQIVREQSIQWGAQGLTASDLLSWCIQLATVLSFLHSQSPAIIHRDIKLENILLASPLKGRSKGQGPEIRLIDFGLACPLCAADKKPDPGPERQSFAVRRPSSAFSRLSKRLTLRQASKSSAKSDGRSPGPQQEGLIRTTNRFLYEIDDGIGTQGPDSHSSPTATPKFARVTHVSTLISSSPALSMNSVAPSGIASRQSLLMSRLGGDARSPASAPSPGALDSAEIRVGTEGPQPSRPTFIRASSRRNASAAREALSPSPRSHASAARSSVAMMGIAYLSTTVEDQEQDRDRDLDPQGLRGGSRFATGTTEVLLELTGHIGSLLYMPPEVYNEQPYNEKADVFSFAMVMYELLHRRTLMHRVFELNPRAGDDDDSVDLIVANYAKSVANHWAPYRPPIGSFIPTGLSDLIVRCWSHQPLERPSISEVLSILERILRDEDLSSLDEKPGGERVDCPCI